MTRIGPSGRTALHLLACCPRMPTDVVAVMLRMRHARSAAQLLARLRRAGLAQYQIARLGLLLGSQPIRLWTLTPAGQAVLTGRALAPSLEDDGRLPYGTPERTRKTAHQRHLPMLVSAYRLLGDIVSGLPQTVSVAAWEHPWIRTVGPAEGGRARHVRLPAAGVLIDRRADDGRAVLRLLLVPDPGTAPLASYRSALRGLVELRQATLVEDVDDEPLLVVGVATPRDSCARADAWRSLLEQVARRTGERPLRTRVLAHETRRARDGGGGNDQHITGQIDEAFSLIARHPLLTRRQLASLVGTSTTRVAHLVTELVEHGWVRPIQLDDHPHATVAATHHDIQRLGLVELTPAGRREAARRLLMSAALALRRHGLLHGDAAGRRFFRHLHHTLGANAFFVALAAAAMHVNKRGGDEALVEWRSAAACARGLFRPDGYGCYRRGPARFGFFLEYDRGTERSSHYAAKLATYYRYRNSSGYKRDYQSFPSLLVVTTSDAAEARFVQQAHLAQEHHANAPLSIFLTTTSLIEACPDGALGPIWRTAAAPWADRPERVCWLPQPGRGPHQHARTPLKRLDNAHVL